MIADVVFHVYVSTPQACLFHTFTPFDFLAQSAKQDHANCVATPQLAAWPELSDVSVIVCAKVMLRINHIPPGCP